MEERRNLSNASTLGTKRPRPREGGGASGAAQKIVKAHKHNGPLPDTAESDFTKGAIVRLRLHHFLTFDDVELHPSPQLNVIVGPNGTGKSSIVCAMCLGLGGRTTLLGRAKEIKDFIKHGKTEGFIEIELYEPRGRNPIIRRLMNIRDNSSSWLINGKSTQMKEVTELVKDMRIQLDNKCQFLPQDMVVEFAKMNIYQLLEETEKAIGPPTMHKSHCELKKLKEDQFDFQRRLKAKLIELSDEKRKNQLLERDVERFRKRQAHLKTISYLKKKKCWVEYENARNNFKHVKDSRKVAERNLRIIRHKYQPIRNKQKEQEEAVKKFKETEQAKSQALHHAQRQVKTLQEQLQTLEDELEVPRQDLEEKKREEMQRRKKVENFKKEIQGFRNELGKLEKPESLQPKISEKNARCREIQHKINQLAQRQGELRAEKQQYEDQIRVAEGELRRMQDIRNQRLEMLQRRDRDTHSAILWLQNNQHLFKERIFEPVSLLVNIKDSRYTNAIEAFLSGRDFFSFVTQNQEDMEKFLREVRDKQRLRVNVVRVPDKPLSAYKSPIPFETLQRYGFQQMMVNLIEAPEPVLCYFCEFQGLHQVPLGGDLNAAQIDRVLKELPNLRSFYTSSYRYSVKRSLYANKSSVRSSELWSPRFLVASIDTERKSALEAEIQSAMQSMKVFDDQYSELEEQDRALRQEDNRIRQEKTDLRKVLDSHKKIQSNISSREAKLEQIQKSSFDLKAEEKRCEQAVDRIQHQRVDCIKKLFSQGEIYVKATVEKVMAALRCRGAEMKVDYLMAQYRQAKRESDNAEQEVKSLEHREAEAKDKAQRLLTRARHETGVNSPEENAELMQEFHNFPGELDAIEDQIHECQAQADMCMGTDESVVQEFEAREQRVATLQEEVESMQGDLEGREGRMEELKKQWLDPLNKLLGEVSEKFSEFFSGMGCAGEVQLSESEDFSKYGVQIRVKFRDNEDLQALTAHRQSGGERSVSTMLYLMALQGITSCPFRVVDEINQGMDPVNERRVFDLIVRTASRRKTAQYFLLSPKLLQNLTYTEAVKVHVVYNGQEMVPFRQWNMAKFLE